MYIIIVFTYIIRYIFLYLKIFGKTFINRQCTVSYGYYFYFFLIFILKLLILIKWNIKLTVLADVTHSCIKFIPIL